MIRIIVLGFISIAYIMAATTTVKPHHSHATKEPSEHENFRFTYEPHTHMMVLVNGHTCYIFPLTDDERVAVHTDAGIAALEYKLLSSLTTATLTTPSEDQLVKTLSHACGGHNTTYYMATI